MNHQQRQISSELLESEVEGLRLRGPRLRDNLGPAPTLLIFLRHFG